MRRTLWSLTAVAVITVIVAGCGNGTAGTGSGGTSTAAEPAGGSRNHNNTAAGHNTTAPTTHEKAVKFAECMRANGVSAFPDPDASGGLTVDGVANSSSVDVSSAAFEQAISACKDLEPPGFTGHKRSPEQQAAALQFAQCIRGNGVRDFPDPAPDAPMIDTDRIPSSAAPGGMAILHAAMQKCGQHASAAGVKGP